MNQLVSIRRILERFRWFVFLFLLVCANAGLLKAWAQEENLRRQLEAATGQQRTDVLLKLTVQNRNSNPAQALIYGASALENLAVYPDPSTQVLILSNMAWAHMVLGDYEQGIARAQRGVTAAEKLKDPEELIVPLNVTGLLYWRKAKLDLALSYFFRALDLAQKLNSKSAEAAALNNIGLIYVERGENAKAFEYFSKAKNIQQAFGDKEKLAISMNNIAGIYSAQGDYSQALEMQLAGLKIREDFQDKPGVAELLLNIGITYDHIGAHEKALAHFSQAIKTFESLGDRRAIAQVLNAIGLAYQHKKDYAKAQSHYERSLESAREIDDELIECNALMSLAHLNILQLRPRAAQEYLSLGLKLAKQSGLKSLETQGHLHQAEIYLQQDELDQAVDEAKISAKMADASNEKAKGSEAQYLLSRIYVKKGDYRRALSAYQVHKRINDEIFSKESSDKLAQLQSVHEAERRLKQIELLERDNAIQSAQLEQQEFERNAWILGLLLLFAITVLLYERHSQEKINLALQDSLRMQKEIMQAVAHEFRAPLARVQLATDMLQEHGGGDGEPLFGNINRGLKELDDLLKEILLVLRLEAQEEREVAVSVDLNALLREQVELQRQLYPDKSIQLISGEKELNHLSLQRKYLIWAISNLLSNAMRYSQHCVEVSYRILPDRVEVLVEDDGPGVPPADRHRVFEPFVRLDPSRTRSTGGVGLGLAIVKRLAESCKGSISISESHLGGSRFQLSWPLM